MQAIVSPVRCAALALMFHAVTLLGCLPIAYIFATGATASEIPDPDPARFEQDIRTFEDWDRQNSFPQDAVLFVGSSSIRMWQSAECFPDLPLINRGFGGSHTSDVNHFAERIVLKYKPRVIVFYAGDNDIEAGKTPQQVFDDFQAFASLVHKQLPQTRIIYLPIKPSLARWSKWPRMQEANAHVEKLSKARQPHRLCRYGHADAWRGWPATPRTFSRRRPAHE